MDRKRGAIKEGLPDALNYFIFLLLWEWHVQLLMDRKPFGKPDARKVGLVMASRTAPCLLTQLRS
jgi:hypothetical protein